MTAPHQLPIHLKSWFFWINTVLMALTGGFLAYLYNISGTSLTAVLAVNVGASAPFILGNFTKDQPDIKE